MTVILYRHWHSQEALNEKFVKLLEKCDAVFIEYGSSDTEDLYQRYFEEISTKGYSNIPMQTTLHHEDESLADLLRSTHKKILVEHSPFTYNQMIGLKEMSDRAYDAFDNGKLAEAVAKNFDARTYFVCMNTTRDQYMAVDLNDADKQFNSILGIIGFSHHVEPQLHKINPRIDAVDMFPCSPFFLSMEPELHQRILFRQPISKEFLARVFVQEYLSNYFTTSFVPSQEATVRSMTAVEQVSWKDAEEISKYIRQEGKKFRYEATYLWMHRRGMV